MDKLFDMYQTVVSGAEGGRWYRRKVRVTPCPSWRDWDMGAGGEYDRSWSMNRALLVFLALLGWLKLHVLNKERGRTHDSSSNFVHFLKISGESCPNFRRSAAQMPTRSSCCFLLQNQPLLFSVFSSGAFARGGIGGGTTFLGGGLDGLVGSKIH